MTNPVVHFEIVGREGTKLQQWYAELFGWKIQPLPEMGYGLVEPSEGIGGGIGRGDEPMVTFYVQVDDPQKYLDRVAEMGGRTIIPVTEVPNVVTFALFADPEGNRVGLVKG